MRNIVRVFVLNNLVTFLLFLGKVVVMVLVGATAYFVFSGSVPQLSDQIPTLNSFFVSVEQFLATLLMYN